MKTNSTVTEDEHVNTPSWAKKKKNSVTDHEYINTPLWTHTIP